jgi:hypothetical protein
MNLTLLCPEIVDGGELVKTLSGLGVSASLVPSHHHAVVEALAGRLRITAKVFVEGGDEYSKMILGMHNFFRRNAPQPAPEPLRSALQRIGVSDMALGIVYADAEGEKIVMALASAMDAVVFDGSRLLAPDGRVLAQG